MGKKEKSIGNKEWVLICVFSLVLGLLLGYLLAMGAVETMLQSINIQEVYIDLNESKIVDVAYDKMMRAGKL